MARQREGHFGAAAGSLNMTTSAISMRIRRLEDQLGVTLVKRDSLGVVVTTPGCTRFLSHAHRLLEDARLATLASRGSADSPLFRLGVPGAVGDHPERYKLLALARQLRRELPEATLRCFGTPFNLINGVIKSMLDRAG